jgi:hypothetical protein
LKKRRGTILATIFFIAFILLTTSNIDDDSISSIDFKKSTLNFSTQGNYIISSNVIQTSYSTSDDSEVTSNSIVLLENIVNYIISIQVVHISGDTIKRSLIAQINNAILVLKDEDSDNDKIICNNFVNKFVSNIKLYERIGIFQHNTSSKILQDILILKKSLCDSDNTKIPQ